MDMQQHRLVHTTSARATDDFPKATKPVAKAAATPLSQTTASIPMFAWEIFPHSGKVSQLGTRNDYYPGVALSVYMDRDPYPHLPRSSSCGDLECRMLKD